MRFPLITAIGMCHFLPVHHIGMAYLAGSKVKIQLHLRFFSSSFKVWLTYTNHFDYMWHIVVWIGHSVRLKLSLESLVVQHANHSTVWGIRCLTFSYKLSKWFLYRREFNQKLPLTGWNDKIVTLEKTTCFHVSLMKTCFLLLLQTMY